MPSLYEAANVDGQHPVALCYSRAEPGGGGEFHSLFSPHTAKSYNIDPIIKKHRGTAPRCNKYAKKRLAQVYPHPHSTRNKDVCIIGLSAQTLKTLHN